MILAIDPGSQKTGFAVLQSGPRRMEYITSGIIDVSDHFRFSERLVLLRNDLKTIISKYQPKEVAMESLFFAKNAQSALKLGHARGVLLTVIEDFSLPLFEYSPAEVKLAVAGNGRASKQQVQKMVELLLKLPPKFNWKSLDESDALAIGLAHAQTRRVRQNKNHDRTPERTNHP